MTTGIHHITAIASDGATTVQFYSKVLGLRLVKKTVNQDDTETYHLFFGDKLGHPGMDLTFFIFKPAMSGRAGAGLVTRVSLAIPEAAFEFWQQRLRDFKINFRHEVQFERQRIIFYDPDGLELALVGVPEAETQPQDLWTAEEITELQAIRHFYSATLTVTSLRLIEPVLTQVFGYKKQTQANNVHLYVLVDSQRASRLEILEDVTAVPGINAAGTVHHIAFRARDDKHQQRLRDKVFDVALYPTEVINRFYFKSVYFRTPSGILFEIATDGPGFTADETDTELGQRLALPPFLESQRDAIESRLPPLEA